MYYFQIYYIHISTKKIATQVSLCMSEILPFIIKWTLGLILSSFVAYYRDQRIEKGHSGKLYGTRFCIYLFLPFYTILIFKERTRFKKQRQSGILSGIRLLPANGNTTCPPVQTFPYHLMHLQTVKGNCALCTIFSSSILETLNKLSIYLD